MSTTSPDADGGSLHDPAKDDATDQTTPDNGSPATETVASDADGGSLRDPAGTTKPQEKVFDRTKEIDSLIEEMSEPDGTDTTVEKADEKPETEKTTPADQGLPADDGTEVVKDSPAGGDDTTKEPEKAEDTTTTTTEGEADKPDPDMLTDEELSKLAKPAQRRARALQKKYASAKKAAGFGETISNFATAQGIAPAVLREGLVMIADLVNAKDANGAAMRLVDEISSIVEDKDPTALDAKTKANVMRRLAAMLDPEPETPAVVEKPAAVEIDEDLQEQIDLGTLSKRAALTEMQERNPQKVAPPPKAAAKAVTPTPTPPPVAYAPGFEPSEIAKGREAVNAIDVELRKQHGTDWMAVRPTVVKRLLEYQGKLAPSAWEKFVRDQATIALNAARPKVVQKKVEQTLRPSGGGRQVADKRDDLDRILDAE